MTSQMLRAGRRVTLAGDIAALQAGSPTVADVLLVPGYTGSKEDFAPLLEPLAAAGVRVTAIDLPGQYESPGPPAPADYAPDALATAVCDVARDLVAPVHLLGHSYGGLVARAAVIAKPSLFRSLVLLCSGPAALGGARRARLEYLEPLLSAQGVAAVYAAIEAVETMDAGYVAPSPELAAFLRRRFLASSTAGLQGMGDALRTEPDRVAELAATAVPVLVSCGADDDAWRPAEQQEMAARLGAPFELLPGCAHSPAVENPAATLEVLRSFWLSDPTAHQPTG